MPAGAVVSEFSCPTCGDALERPGDYCLVCRTATADGVVLEVAQDRATVTVFDGEQVLGETTITTIPESGRDVRTERRNFAGRIIDEIRRKRPDAVYMSGDREILAAVQADLHYSCYRVDAANPVSAAIDRRTERALDVVDTRPVDKLGGSHSTLIGGQDGREAVLTVAAHPHVKKVIPGPIETGSAAGGGVRVKVTRADGNGNLRLLVRNGSTVQEVRLVTTAMDRDRGERVRDDIDMLLDDT